MLELNDELNTTCMAYISNATVTGIVTLNIYSASYVMAWRKEGSFCHIFPESASAPVSANSSDSATSDKTITTLIKLIVVSLPFTGLPVALRIGVLAKVSKDAVRFLGCAAGLVMLEIMYIIVLGGVMTACMSYVSGPSVGTVTLVLLGLLLLMWGCCCYHSKCLRYVALCKCCCPDIEKVKFGPGGEELGPEEMV